MKQTLQLKLSQHLALTPQLQQSIRLLQLSTLELNQEIEQALQDNPLLERAEPDEAQVFGGSPDALSHATEPAPSAGEERIETSAEWGEDGLEWPSAGAKGPRDPNDENDADAGELQAAATSLTDHLIAQLALSQLAGRDRLLVAFLIEALDEDGYLDQPLEELAEVLPAELIGEPDEVIEDLQIALKHLQSLDPTGVGARDARECLLLQLANLPATPERTLAMTIVRDHLEQLAAHDYARIKKATGCDDEALRSAQELIRSLNPRPGAQFASLDTRYVVPDVIVRKLRGQWVAQLNQDVMPRLRINRQYADLLRRHRNSGSSNLTGQLQEAKWLIKNVQQRFDTIARVAQAIVDRQRAFFDHGEVAMRPLTLREIAETVDLHESTISRVTTQKYLACPRGIYELKYFFGSHVATDTGGAASSTAIRALIRQLVAAEDGQKPLSDARIADILGEQGFKVARRTVAKYRESLGIPPVNLRKTL
ncbi:RNA polymerase factor sigma-54 [Sulfuricystis thermophila]|uniref:RNA polymerase factor sigma-54 n=1 Tax=Sulfuricystis thermophila TaxID=2496847 RepID=UPI001036B55E|nr:RNA polymerase factor sigma-54 [Sulfuricystis thermophila]